MGYGECGCLCVMCVCVCSNCSCIMHVYEYWCGSVCVGGLCGWMHAALLYSNVCLSSVLCCIILY